MKGIIIAGGFGTRLLPLTMNRPKHLLPVANRPFLEYQVDLLRRHGISEIVFATNYFADKIEDHFGDGSRFGVRMRYAIEREPLGTAGAIRNAAGSANGEAILVLNGDILTDFDLLRIMLFHQDQRAQATIALRKIERPHAFGALETQADGRVTAWNEPTEAEKKAVAENTGPPTGKFDHINAGVYVLEPGAVDRIPAGRPVSIERETYPELISGGERVYGMEPDGYWIDIGRPEQYLDANMAVLTGKVRTEVAFQRIAEDSDVATDVDIDDSTSIGMGSLIGAGSRLAGCIILDNVRVGAGANLRRVIADDGAVVEDEVQSSGTVIESGTTLQRNC